MTSDIIEARKELYDDEVQNLCEEIEDLKSRLKIAHQAILEFSAAQERGPGWYTRGRDGMYAQVRMWITKGFNATNLEREVQESEIL